jgi:hypothetical protein
MRKTLYGQYKLNKLQKSLDYLYPWTESLQKCEERAYGYWCDVIAPEVKKNKRVLIVAHANTIRGLVKAIDNISDDKIAHLRIPNGIPLVYTLDKNLNPVETEGSDDIGFQANYLVSPRNHAKIMKYETCVYKKLRSLFEYLDTDKDGRITPSNLQQGITKLQTGAFLNNINNSSSKDSSNGLLKATIVPVICEYEVEELLRCIPK